MRNRNNPLKNIPNDSFTIIQASHKQFHKYLADIFQRYPGGKITYINNNTFLPLIRFSDEYNACIDHMIINDPDELFITIESDCSRILFIEYKSVWFGVDNPEILIKFNNICKNRARKGGSVVLITAIMDRELLTLDGKADYFFQLGKNDKNFIHELSAYQVSLDEINLNYPDNPDKKGLYGQMQLNTR